MKRILYIIAAAGLSIALFAGCAGNSAQLAQDTADAGGDGTDQSAESTAVPSLSLDADAVSFTDRDSDASYDASDATSVKLSGTDAEIVGSGAALTEGCLTISEQGTYILTGSFTGTVVVDAADDAKIQLVLAGASVEATSGPALLIRQADKVFLTLAENTQNSLADSAVYSVSGDDENADAAIFSKTDLTINGKGALTVTGNYKHGIVSKDDLVVTDGTIAVTSVSTGMNGKDCVKISGGTFSINAGGAGIKSDNEDDESLGYVYISGGDFTIVSVGKGIMGYAALEIVGGTVNIDSEDDSLHTNGSASITGGTFTLSSGDDGIHADSDMNVSGGTLDITKSYEGIEGANINISGGTISVVASDDGLNAAGGADSSGFGGGDGFFNSGSGDYAIVISGGYLIINAGGDGVDSNGTLTVSGGVTLVSGPTNDGDGAIDYQTTGVITGGVVIAAGSSGMAESFEENGSTQCSMLINGLSASGGTRVTLTDANGNVIATFVPVKDYVSVVVSAPSMSQGETYTLYTGGTVEGTDANGYAEGGTLSGGTSFASIEQDSLSASYGSAGGFSHGGGGGSFPSGGGQNPGGGGGSFPGGGSSGQEPSSTGKPAV